MPQTMTEDTAQGIYWELNFVLKPDWTMTKYDHGFHVGPPIGQHAGETLQQLLLEETWRIAQFVAYADFTSIELGSDGSHTISSRKKNGKGFQVVIDPNAAHLPNHRPKADDADGTNG
jgi:hypothetical protein